MATAGFSAAFPQARATHPFCFGSQPKAMVIPGRFSNHRPVRDPFARSILHAPTGSPLLLSYLRFVAPTKAITEAYSAYASPLVGLSMCLFTNMAFLFPSHQPHLGRPSSRRAASSSYHSNTPTLHSLFSWENLAKATLTMFCLNPSKNDPPLAIMLTIAFSYILTCLGVSHQYQMYIRLIGTLVFAVVFTWKGWREKTSKDVLKRLEAMEDKMDVILRKIQ